MEVIVVRNKLLIYEEDKINLPICAFTSTAGFGTSLVDVGLFSCFFSMISGGGTGFDIYFLVEGIDFHAVKMPREITKIPGIEFISIERVRETHCRTNIYNI